jgi:hypothetical protein
MFVRNLTTLDAALARGRINDELAAGAVVLSHMLHIGDGTLSPLVEPLEPSEHDPPQKLMRLVLWEGVSVTAAGVAPGPTAPPFVRPVLFRIGAAERRLIVFGDRRWVRRFGGGLEATTAAPFETIELSFKRGFGGAYDLPPGLLPGTDLPHPGLRVTYTINANGVGFYADQRSAEGSPLPNIERPDQLVRHWNDAPEPAGLTPCPELTAWRMKQDADALSQQPSRSVPHPSSSFRLLHSAPPPLIFDDVPFGTSIELHGLRGGPVRFQVPPAPATVSIRARGSKTETPLRATLRALHVDAERRTARFVYGHCFPYHPERAPSWVRIA